MTESILKEAENATAKFIFVALSMTKCSDFFGKGTEPPDSIRRRLF
jgi:hypothetical protein